MNDSQTGAIRYWPYVNEYICRDVANTVYPRDYSPHSNTCGHWRCMRYNYYYIYSYVMSFR